MGTKDSMDGECFGLKCPSPYYDGHTKNHISLEFIQVHTERRAPLLNVTFVCAPDLGLFKLKAEC